MLEQKPVDKIVIIDFDGTLCKFAFPDVGPIEPNVKIALETLRQAGYTIKIHSCRTATYWNREDERRIHIEAIFDFMTRHNLPYDELITSPSMDKPIATAYIDDRSIEYNNNWLEIAERLKERIK